MTATLLSQYPGPTTADPAGRLTQLEWAIEYLYANGVSGPDPTFNSVTVTTAVVAASAELTTGDLTIDKGNIGLTKGNLTVTAGNLTVTKGSATLGGNVITANLPAVDPAVVGELWTNSQVVTASKGP